MKYLTTFSLFLMVFISACSLGANSAKDTNKRPAHHTDTGFKNLYIEDVNKSIFEVLKMRFFSEKWADHETFANQIPWQQLNLNKVHTPSKKPQVSWLGHSTFLIQYHGVNILTDPVFCERTSPISFMGPRRYTKHVVDYSKLPKIDYVIISHNHYDHLDVEATALLHKQETAPRYFVPLGIKSWLLETEESIDANNIVEMDWWDHSDHNHLQIKAYPSQHWSTRTTFDRFETLWASWRVQLSDFSFWFAGDTGYNERLFTELGEMMAPVDLSFIPIGAYDPRDFMKPYHVNPEEAVKIHQHIPTKRSIGMHWGTYPLTAEEPTEPPVRLKAAAEKAGLTEGEFTVMKLGETRVIDH